MAANPRDSLARQLAAAGLSPEWQDWVTANLGRGCAPESLVEILVANGHSADFAASALKALSLRPSAAASPGPGYAYEPSRLGSGHTLFLSDRIVQVAARLERPDVAVLAGFLSGAECEELIELSRSKLRRSTVVNPANGGEDEIGDRSSEGTYFAIGENDLVARLDRRLAELTGLPVDHGEGIQILRYGIGGEYKPHFDYFPPRDSGSAAHLAKGGQRVATVVMYLNDVAAGGETHFPDAGGFRVAPRQGWAAYFSYCNSLGQVDPATLHGGAPVLAGEKWIATKWIRQNRYG
jgi:prolyl 4-hydroxylase